MAFDPDAYLAATATQEPPAHGSFDPDEYLRQTAPAAPPFDPDKYLAATAPAQRDQLSISSIDDLTRAEDAMGDRFKDAKPIISGGGIKPGAIVSHVLSKWVDNLNTATGSDEEANKDPEIQKLRQEGDSPVVQLPKPALTGIPSGIVRGLETSAEGLTAPTNLEVIGALAAAPASVVKVAAAGFAGQMAHDLPDKIRDITDAKTPAEAAQKSTEALAQVMMIAGAGKHTFGRETVPSVTRIGSEDVTRAPIDPYASAATPAEPSPTAPAPAAAETPASQPGAGSAEAKDWTSATEENAAESPKGMKRAGGEAGALTVPKIKLEDRKMSELDAATTDRSGKLQRSTDDARRAQAEINKAIPDETRQGAVSLWIEADGDTTKLSAWEAGAKEKVFRDAAKAAQSLTPEETAIAQKVKTSFDVLEQRGNKYDVLGAHRDNYVPHVWDVDKTRPAMTGGGKLQQNFKFAKARTFDTFAAGDAAGFKPKTLAIGKLLPAYLHEMNKVIADRQFVEALSKAKASDGRPLVVPRGRVSDIETDAGGKAYLANPRAMKGLKDAAGNDVDTSDYKTMENQPALHDWRWEGKDTEGNPIYMKDDLALHPEAAKRLNSIVGKSALREWYNDPAHTGSAKILPVIVKALDTAQSVMKREMFSLLAPFHAVQEATHAIGHVINPLYNIPKIDLRDAKQLDAAKHGLMLLPDKTSAQSYLEGVGGKGGFVSQVARKFGGAAGKAVAGVIDGYQDYLFQKYIPGLKFKTFEAMVERNTKRFSGELASGKLTPSDVKLLSAEQANAAYGHLNYQLLDRSPTFQHVLQLGLLAPDFLEARGRFVVQASKALIGAKGGREQLKAIAVLAAVQAGVAYTMSQLMGDKWDPTHPFEVTHNGRRYMMRSVPEDLHRLLFQGPDQRREFVSGRINPVAQKADQLRTGLNYRGEKVGAIDTMEELLANYIPITARSIPGIRQLTETSRQNPVSPIEQLAGSLGLKISRYSPVSETHKLASQWMEKQKVPKDTGSYPVSKYQQLRYALEDGDMERAGAEYKKLLAGAPAYKLASGFRESMRQPFTKSAAMDAEFKKSLKPADVAIYDLAVQKRTDVLNRFSALR